MNFRLNEYNTFTHAFETYQNLMHGSNKTKSEIMRIHVKVFNKMRV